MHADATGAAMIDPLKLSQMDSVQLRKLLDSYKRARVIMRSTHSSRRADRLSTDIRRADEMIRHINNVLRLKTKNRRPLREFQ